MYSIDSGELNSIEPSKCTHREIYNRNYKKEECKSKTTKDDCLKVVNSQCDETMGGTKGSEYKGC